MIPSFSIGITKFLAISKELWRSGRVTWQSTLIHQSGNQSDKAQKTDLPLATSPPSSYSTLALPLDTTYTISQIYFQKGGLLNTQKANSTQAVHFTGLIAAKRFNITPSGVPKLTLQIAEHPNPSDPGYTIYHKNVTATRELAETLNNLSPPLMVGEEVEVKKGFPYSWPYTDKSGRDRENRGVTLWIIVVRGTTYVAKRKPKTTKREKISVTQAESAKDTNG